MSRPLNSGHFGHSRYREPSSGQSMRAFLVEITAKLIIRSDTEPDDLPADIYSQIAEFIHSDDDILDLSIEALPLPPNVSGQDSH